MRHYLEILKDREGNNYLGMRFSPEEVQPFINQMQDLLGEQFQEYLDYKNKQDQIGFVLKLLTVSEFNNCSLTMGFDKFTNFLNHLCKVEIDDLKLIGLGSAEKLDNKCFFVIVKSELLNETLVGLGSNEKDLHITLGFKYKDVLGVKKDELIKSKDSFLKKLKLSYTKEGDSFEFIKGLPSFDLNFFKQIEPIKINETSAIFRCGDNDYLQISLVDDRITITGKWQETDKLPILSNTLIERKFKQIN